MKSIKNVTRKLAASAMALAILCSGIPVHAATTDVSAPGTSDCTVTATMDSSYTVQLPLDIALTKQADDSYSGTYSVGVKGNIAGNKKVSVTPAASFVMTGATTSETVTANVTQNINDFVRTVTAEGTQKECNNTGYTTTDGSVKVNAITQADSYSGTLVFTIAFDNL